MPDVARDPLAQLKTIVGPGGTTPAPFDWAAIEADLGRPLPPDCKLLYEAYGVSHGFYVLRWNGITIPSPLLVKQHHEEHAEYDAFTPLSEPPWPDFPTSDELLLCCTTEGRGLLAWDTWDTRTRPGPGLSRARRPG